MYTNDKTLMLVRSLCRMVLGLLLVTTQAYAQSQASPFLGCNAPINVIFINGVDTDSDGAWKNLRAFQSYAPKTAADGRALTYDLAYNATLGTRSDVLESVRQKFQQYTGFATLYETFSIFLADTVANSTILQSLPPAIAVRVQQDAEAFKKEAYPKILAAYVESNPDLKNVYEGVRTQSKSQGLLLLGHSQGTLFANQLYQLLLADGFDAAAFTTVGVAAPVHAMRGRVTGEEQYVTSQTDVLLQLIKKVDSLTLPPNFVGGLPTLGNNLGHSFINAYLDNGNLRNAILNTFTQALAGLKKPECIPPSVEVTLSGTQQGWTVSPTVTLSGLVLMQRSSFSQQGTPGNTCGGERGGPLYSLDSAIDPEVEFFGAPLVQGAPYINFPNRRPCSSFVAYKFYLDPSNPADQRKSMPRFWINATARAQTFSGDSTTDREYQLRIDTGDPFKSAQGFRCEVGTVPNSFAGWFRAWSPTSCTAKFVP